MHSGAHSVADTEKQISQPIRNSPSSSVSRLTGIEETGTCSPAEPLLRSGVAERQQGHDVMQTDMGTGSADGLDQIRQTAFEHLKTAAYHQGCGECLMLYHRFMALVADPGVARELDRFMAELAGAAPIMSNHFAPEATTVHKGNPVWVLEVIQQEETMSRTQLVDRARREGRSISDHALSVYLSKLKNEGLIERISKGKYRAVQSAGDHCNEHIVESEAIAGSRVALP
jgi:hypothetical protein